MFHTTQYTIPILDLLFIFNIISITTVQPPAPSFFLGGGGNFKYLPWKGVGDLKN